MGLQTILIPIIFKIAFHEWVAMLSDVFSTKTSIINKIKYLLKPPGWKHDGTGTLSSDMRKEWKEKQKSEV